MSLYKELPTPVAIIDMDILQRNIDGMAARLAASGILHRPHIKSHKSAAIARMQLAAGAIGITTAKLSEAEVFAAAGVESILIAYPLIGADKLERFAKLHMKCGLLTTVDSAAGAAGLSEVGVRTGKPVEVLIELDGGLHRGGRQAGGDAVRFALEINKLPGIRISGLMGYFGTIYQNSGEAAFIEATRAEAALMMETAALFREAGLPADVISTGSSPAALMCRELEGVTEVRAGNYVFFDASGVGMGLASEDDCALRVIATVVSTPLPGRATIDAGTKSLTSDKAHGRDGFGIIAGHPEVKLAALNEEHGFLQFDPLTSPFQIGDRIEIIPNHSCVIPNLNARVAGVRGGQWTEWITVDARGCMT
ncbi:alanine racemase [Paenibacillus sp. S150]|uniref:alanine racemase n=1 Tax=Paenibacillus sp. S150 TaxID=2749826 RepID=UPI001C57C21F|nr:alanine racemase [Paenibacillus sp. S150]MBW4085768.1 alanine racemase [Paenibacillus sp. S150]